MRQYTTSEQTSKLIELGFEKPKNALPIREENKALVYQLRYTIGELIEMLPETMGDSVGWSFDRSLIGSVVCYSRDNREAFADLYYCDRSVELIDNLFYMIVKLKEEGVI